MASTLLTLGEGLLLCDCDSLQWAFSSHLLRVSPSLPVCKTVAYSLPFFCKTVHFRPLSHICSDIWQLRELLTEQLLA